MGGGPISSLSAIRARVFWGSLSLAEPEERWPFQFVPVIALAILDRLAKV